MVTFFFVQHDSECGRKRVLKKFPATKSGTLTRKAKDFYLAKLARCKYPVFLAHDLSPLFGPHSKHSGYSANATPRDGATSPEPTTEPADATEAPTPSPHGEEVLFDNPPDQLPD